MARAVVLLYDPGDRSLFARELERAGFVVSAYARPREWPFFGQILSGRCHRIGQCGAEALVADDHPDPLMTGVALIEQQLQQGCRCVENPQRAHGKLLVTRKPEDVLGRLQLLSRGVKVMLANPDPAIVRHWIAGVPRQSWTEQPAALAPSISRVLFMRCPFTGQILPADALKRLQDHFASLGHLLSARQVFAMREKAWCDAAGNPIQLEPGELERMRLTTE